MPDPHSAQAAGWLLLSLGSLIVILRQGVGFWRDIARPSGADAIAQAASRFQERGDYVSRKELEEKLSAITSDLHSLRREINDLEQRQIEASDERIRTVHERIDGIPERIIAQLSNLVVLLRPGPSQG